MRIPENLIVSAGAQENRVFVAGIGAAHLSGPQIDDSQPHGHKHFGIVSLAQRIVHPGEDLLRRQAGPGRIFDRRFGLHHEHGARYALAGYIRDDQSHSVDIQEEEVIEIPAHFPGRIHQGIDFEFAAGKAEVFRQGGLLDRGCQLQILLHPPLRLVDVSLQRVHGPVDIIRQFGKLQGGSHGDLFLQIAGGDSGQGSVHFPQLLHDDFFHHQGDQQVERAENQDVGEDHIVDHELSAGAGQGGVAPADQTVPVRQRSTDKNGFLVSRPLQAAGKRIPAPAGKQKIQFLLLQPDLFGFPADVPEEQGVFRIQQQSGGIILPGDQALVIQHRFHRLDIVSQIPEIILQLFRFVFQLPLLSLCGKLELAPVADQYAEDKENDRHRQETPAEMGKHRRPFLRLQRALPRPVMGPPLNRQHAEGHAQRGEYDHRNGADLNHIIGHVKRITFRQQHGIHMENLHGGPGHKGLRKERCFPFENPEMHRGRQKTRQRRGQPARDPGEGADLPELPDQVALHASDQPRQNAGERIEEEPGGQRADIPDIEHHQAVLDAQMIRGNAAQPEKHACRDPERKSFLPLLPEAPGQRRRRDVHRHGGAHFQNHYQGLHVHEPPLLCPRRSYGIRRQTGRFRSSGPARRTARKNAR